MATKLDKKPSKLTALKISFSNDHPWRLWGGIVFFLLVGIVAGFSKIEWAIVVVAGFCIVALESHNSALERAVVLHIESNTKLSEKELRDLTNFIRATGEGATLVMLLGLVIAVLLLILS